MVMLMTNNAVS